MIIFGVAEIFFSQIPDFDQISWLSILAAVMSFTYSSIGLGLGIIQVIGIYATFLQVASIRSSVSATTSYDECNACICSEQRRAG